MIPKVAAHPWSAEALFNKSLLYTQEMERFTADDWRFGLWSSFTLELLARAALAHISPTLLANGRDWHNIHYALGHAPTKKDFRPNSALMTEVLSMLNEVVPKFTKELQNFCILHCSNRNAEVHTGEEKFRDTGASEWIPQFYASCKVLLESMGKTLADFFDDPKTAEEMIASLIDTAAKAVAQEIDKHKNAWSAKNPEEQQKAVAQAAAWASRHLGHRKDCPACNSPALIKGSGWGTVTMQIDEQDNSIVQRQTMLPSSFECIACGLKIGGFSRLSACGLGDPFVATYRSSPEEFFDLHTEEELAEARARAEEPEQEEDFNEP